MGAPSVWVLQRLAILTDASGVVRLRYDGVAHLTATSRTSDDDDIDWARDPALELGTLEDPKNSGGVLDGAGGTFRMGSLTTGVTHKR
jgi:hypothetical protein